MARKPVTGPIVWANGIIITINWSQGTRRYTNVFYGTTPAARPLPATLPETLFTAYKTGNTSSGWIGQVHTTCTMTGVTIKDISVASQPNQFSTSASQAGTSTGGPLPAQVAMVVTLSTAMSGRAFRGRCFLGGIGATALNDADTHTAASGTAAAAFVNAILAANTSNGISTGVFGRALQAGTLKNGTPVGPRTAQFTPIIQARITSQRWDTQRRRLGGVTR
jgi:hypothetical protein